MIHPHQCEHITATSTTAAEVQCCQKSTNTDKGGAHALAGTQSAGKVGVGRKTRSCESSCRGHQIPPGQLAMPLMSQPQALGLQGHSYG